MNKNQQLVASGLAACLKAVLRAPAQAALLAAALAASPAALADAVTDWNVFADSINLGPPPFRARATAIMHVAIHDALNSIDAYYGSYAKVPPARKGASPDAAVGEAAYRALVGVAPALTMPITTFYNTWYGALPGCPSAACTDGIAAGAAAANAILLLRNSNSSSSPHLPYTLPVAPGVYQPTPVTSATPPPAELPPLAPQFAGWANVMPFVLKSGSQFRAEPSPLFDLTGFIYTRDFLEVKTVGRIDAETLGDRTADQSEIARFWPGGGANMNLVARIIIAGRGLDLWQHARLFALLNMANSDAAVTVFDTKYTYNFWRPVTAIRAATTDGNPFTTPDGEWLSYQNTPPYPDYTCGLTNATGSRAGGAAQLLRY